MTQVGTPITVTATLTRRQAVRMQATPGRILLCALAYLGLVLVPAAAAGGLIALESRWEGLAVAVTTAVVMAVFTAVPVLLRWWWVPTRRPHELGVGIPVEWTFGPQGVAVASRLSAAELAWRSFADVRARAGLLALRQRGAYWHMGLPVADLGDRAADQVVGWWRDATASPRPAAQRDEAVVSRPDGDLLVETGPVSRAFLRLAVDPGGVMSLAESRWTLFGPVLGLGLLVVGGLGREVVPAVGGAVFVGASLLVVLLHVVAVRSASRRPYPVSSYRTGPRSIGVAWADGWVHVPWEQVSAVVLAPDGLVVRRRPPHDQSFALPTAGASDDDLRDVVRWAGVFGVPVHDRRTTRSWLLGGRARADVVPPARDAPTA